MAFIGAEKQGVIYAPGHFLAHEECVRKTREIAQNSALVQTTETGKYVPMGSGIFMAMVFGGILIPVQGLLADKIGILSSYWLSIGLLAYVLFYALVLSKPVRREV